MDEKFAQSLFDLRFIKVVYVFNARFRFTLSIVGIINIDQGCPNFFQKEPKMNLKKLKEPKIFIDHQAYYKNRDFRMMTAFIHTHMVH